MSTHVPTLHIGFLLYPDVTPLDVTGPAQVLGYLPGAQVSMVWKQRGPVQTDAGYAIVANTTFDDCPALDVISIPGGPGLLPLVRDEPTLTFVREQAERARYVTSVCTGSLLLGAAGLLVGYRAGCHWAYRSLLPRLGARPSTERVVRDRNRITAGGVTAGIDFGLSMAAELLGPRAAQHLQLGLEYAPAPPFDAGTPEAAGPELVAEVDARFATRRQGYLDAIQASPWVPRSSSG